jgi:Uncharacterised nucleotidyltransferase
VIDTLPQSSATVSVAATRPEIQLLLCCLRTHMPPERAEEMKALLRGDIDWAYVNQLAQQHRVIPLLYRNLHATCPEAVPETVLEQLQRYFHGISIRNLFLVRELLALLSMLEAHGIPAIPYKGPVLTASVYGNPALRQFKDLDILVREQDAARARDLLLSQGYRLQHPTSAAYEVLFRGFRQTYDLVREDDQVLLELHWNIISWPVFFAANSTSFWEHLESVSLVGRPVRTLAPEDVLALLCVHGAKHHWERLAMICDIAELVHTYPGLDWGRALEQTGRLGGARMLYLGLFLAQDLLGATVPVEMLRQIDTDPMVRLLAAQVRGWLFAGPDSLLKTLQQHAFYLRLAEHLQDRVWCGLCLTPRMIARVVYYATSRTLGGLLSVLMSAQAS